MTVYTDPTEKSDKEIINSIIKANHFKLKSDGTILWSTPVPDWPNDPYASKQVTAPMLEQLKYAMSRFTDVANIKFSEVAPDSTSSEMKFFAAEQMTQTIGAAALAVMNNGDAFATVQFQISNQTERDWITAAHEIGHILGLSHTKEMVNGAYQESPYSKNYSFIDTVMSYNTQGSTPFDEKYKTLLYKNWEFQGYATLKNLGINDIAAIQYLFGANYNYNSTDTRYTYDPKTLNFYDTIWDGGGVDTIDLSLFSLGTDLNLTEGTRSSVYITVNRNDGDLSRMYDGTSAIGIAYGAKIENAAGTQGNDTILGNELDNTIFGNNGNDTLYGNAGDDHLYGGTGTDTLYGGAGNDTLDGGLGADKLYGEAGNDYLYGDGSDTLHGGSGHDRYFISDTQTTIVELQNEGEDTITILSNSIYSYNLGSNIENLDSTQLEQNILISGNDLNNYIRLGSGNDTIIGGKGNDRLAGRGGSDTYIFNKGDGSDIIGELGKDVPASRSDTDVLKFGDGITSSQLWFTKDDFYGALNIGVIGTTDSISIEYWYSNSRVLPQWGEAYIEKIQTSDGKTLTYDKVDQLVNAMAAFTPPSLGQTSLPSNYQQALSPVIAAAWS